MKVRLLAVGAAVLALAGCGGATDSAAPAESAAPEARTLTVFAAASLTDVFTELETQFERDNPGVDVVLNYGASSDLAQQLVNGGPADVFASASAATMTTVTDAGLIEGDPEVFAQNKLQIVTAPGNPENITGFADLARPDLQVVVCAPQVPCGAAAEKVEMATGITLTPVSEEPDVRSTLGRVTTGNADAGLVYVTDVASAGDTVEGIAFPEADSAVTDYPIGVLTSAPQPELAQAWTDLVTGADGQAVLTGAGFVGAP
ncbi:molybdate ABC transporter substrate-binding protein [Pseudonocardia abyssalis]|jgi:molybdate transport system substrate-binding protein|uniref:Molybdate ABC transporter substrate-binding protein n=1 Tax=Pseudonocardia abyssalis TaxID=2792008 RepID=A0ABS6UZY4_9PSEU|nr:molybdate ABC transporter substrate-binding protein [Pseudonocardia abyssalis]MBW0117993.1 molybdate ABC transporter substrate-binding protein [Pseudonocardia abyssalis]MBW0137829.1 molybdate ABC transporter substrate-binding protein [Pseudonocardia abyssalis]